MSPSLASTLQNETGFLVDQARALRRIGDDEAAWSTLLRIPAGVTALPLANHWWTDRHIMSRDALKAGRPDLAYKLASEHGLASGSGFADAEFLAGWIALRFLDEPQKAIGHFQRLVQRVNLPITLGRGYYWLGRAEEAENRPEAAARAYRSAAEYAETYYGQLALTRLENSPNLTLPRLETIFETSERTLIENDDRMRAILLLVELGELNQLRIFALHLAREIEGPPQFALLTNVMTRLGDRTASLRIAKLASYQRILLPQFTPLIDLPGSASAIEPALALAIVRQESEFDADATSTAGARGLMQLMPASAKATAVARKIPYRSARLSEPAYNLQLGTALLAEFIREWGGSYVLGIAAYNAGPGNVKRWIETYGDPRNPEVDPVDWVEMIPYGETRNYVQRVLENLQVYRNAIAGVAQPLRLAADLYRPNGVGTHQIQLGIPVMAAE